ncbi:unnamed protein product [Adineta ricciae]|uniref:Uncharacterized protein n=1 Tax=Adineta ricciae TaxID=249248 RepID=A0A813WS84_ADIRI|nr:unnamed protein product [Adineta ricciae]CAF0865390.1 unnamed protein product [Adineta ricciae]
MFLVILIFFSQYFPLHSLQCLTSSDTLLTVNQCKFKLHTTDSFPNDQTLSGSGTNCKIKEASTQVLIVSIPGTCYAELTINYAKKKVKLVANIASAGVSGFIDPYDDMFGFATGIERVIQYKVNANTEAKRSVLITRVQCTTSDNCAIRKLRDLFPKLMDDQRRLKILEEVDNLLNKSPPPNGTDLKCLSDNETVAECTTGEDRCFFVRDKLGETQRGCTTYDSNEANLEVRFNIIEKMSAGGVDTSPKALKSNFLCADPMCNNDGNFQSVTNLLAVFATDGASSKLSNVKNISTIQVQSQTALKHHEKPNKGLKGNDASCMTSMIYQPMILILCIIFNQLFGFHFLCEK